MLTLFRGGQTICSTKMMAEIGVKDNDWVEAFNKKWCCGSSCSSIPRIPSWYFPYASRSRSSHQRSGTQVKKDRRGGTHNAPTHIYMKPHT